MEKLKFRVYPYYHGNDDHSVSTPYEDDWQLDENDKPFIAGQINVDELIQSFEMECDINNIIAQHLAVGTLSDLAVTADNEQVVDVSNIPSDINTQNDMALKTKKIYDSLNDEQKALFNGFEDFLLNFDKLFKNNNNSEDVNNES